MKTIPACLSKYFWDTDISQIDLHKNKKYLVSRILHMGDEEALKWLHQTYSNQELKKIVNTSRELSEKDKNFFNLIY